MIATYTQADKSLGIHLIYSKILLHLPVPPGMGSESQTRIMKRKYRREEDPCQSLGIWIWFVWNFINVGRL